MTPNYFIHILKNYKNHNSDCSMWFNIIRSNAEGVLWTGYVKAMLITICYTNISQYHKQGMTAHFKSSKFIFFVCLPLHSIGQLWGLCFLSPDIWEWFLGHQWSDLWEDIIGLCLGHPLALSLKDDRCRIQVCVVWQKFFFFFYQVGISLCVLLHGWILTYS